jgi:L-iditol 2-dehydrogenase
VAIEPGVPCEACFLCREGKYNLCDDVAFSGVYPHDGTVQRLKCHKAKWVQKLPDNLTYAQGALLEPLSVVLHAISSCGLSIGRPAAIHGAGPIGLIAPGPAAPTRWSLQMWKKHDWLSQKGSYQAVRLTW